MGDLKEHPPVARAAARALCETLLSGVIEPVRRVARDAGYAITVHGSLARDIDLVAIPWIEHNVSTPDYLVDRIAAVIAGQVGRCAVYRSKGKDPWTEKPHGRKSITILAWNELFGSVDIDISVMPSAPKTEDAA